MFSDIPQQSHSRIRHIFGAATALLLCATTDSSAHGVPPQVIATIYTVISAPVLIPLVWYLLKRFTAIRYPFWVASLCQVLAGVWAVEAANILPGDFLWGWSLKYFLLWDIAGPCLTFALLSYGIHRLIKPAASYLKTLLWGILAPLVVLWLYIRGSGLLSTNDKLLFQAVALVGVYISISLSPLYFYLSEKGPYVRNQVILFFLTGIISLSLAQITFPYFGTMVFSKDLLSWDQYSVNTAAKLQKYSKNPVSTKLLISAFETDYPFVHDSLQGSLVVIGKRAVPALIDCINDAKQFEQLPQQDGTLRTVSLKRTRFNQCRNTLGTITGNNFGKDNDAWLKWWDSHKDTLSTTLNVELPSDPLDVTDPRNLGQLEAKLQSPDLFDRVAAIRAIALINDKRSIEILTKQLREEIAPNPIMWTCKSLEQLGAFTTEPVPSILKERLTPAYTQIAVEAARCLTRIDDPDTTELILARTSPWEAARLADTLYEKYPQKEEAIIASLKNTAANPDRRIRLTAVQSLKSIRTQKALELLKARRDTENDGEVLRAINELLATVPQPKQQVVK